MSIESAAAWPHESEIVAFEAQDRAAFPAAGQVLFTGSSTIRFWSSLKRDFPFLDVLNRGFGGSVLSELVHYAPRIVMPYRPRAIVIYSGENDIALGAGAADVAGHFEALLALVAAALPGVPLYYIGIKPSVGRWALHDVMQDANARVCAIIAARGGGVHYVDVHDAMLDGSGLPRAALFTGDGVHLSRAGYDLWREVLTPVLRPFAVR